MRRRSFKRRRGGSFRSAGRRGLMGLGLAGALVAGLTWFNSRDGAPPIPPAPGPVVVAQASIIRPESVQPPMPEATPERLQTVIAAVLAPPAPAPARPRWIENAVAAKPANGRPMIAVVIDDMGLDRRRSARALELPGPLTMSFLPYAQDLPVQAAEARRRGHELMVHVPMEAMDRSVNPGPNPLTTDLPADEIQRRLHAALGAFDGYVGINNHMGSRFTSDRNAMTPVLAELKNRGLLFLDSRTGPSVGMELAEGLDLPHTARDVFLDHDVSPQAVADSLRRMEATARRSGHAVAIGHPKDETLAQLSRWLPGLEAKGFALVPVSAIVRARRPETPIQAAATPERH